MKSSFRRSRLSTLVHSRGINVRFLGMIAANLTVFLGCCASPACACARACACACVSAKLRPHRRRAENRKKQQDATAAGEYRSPFTNFRDSFSDDSDSSDEESVDEDAHEAASTRWSFAWRRPIAALGP